MKAAALIVTLAIGLGVLPLSAAAQPARKVARIGYLTSALCPGDPGWVGVPLRDGLEERGYAVGQDVIFECRRSEEASEERFRDLAAELARLDVDVIVAISSTATRAVRSATSVTTGDAEVRAAKQATNTIPIVMAVSGDPVRSGYVASLARSGGNVTGMSFLSPELSGKLLELLKESLPTTSHVAVLWNAANPVKEIDFQEAQRAARRWA